MPSRDVQVLLAGGPLNGMGATVAFPDEAPGTGVMMFPDPSSQVGGHFIYQRAYLTDDTEPWIFRFDPTRKAVIDGAPHPTNN